MKHPANVLDDRRWLFVSTHGTQLRSTIFEHLSLMVELAYVKKRKRRKATAIIAGVASLATAVFIIVAFLGRFVGTFTVALDSGDVQLSLSEKSSFENATSYIKFDELPSFDLTTFTNLPDASEIDNEQSDYLYGVVPDGKGNSVLRYFKTTFYIKNTGETTADYDLKVNITKNDPGTTAKGGLVYLDTILRVMVYENNADTSEHNYTVYAHKRTTPNSSSVEADIFKEYTSYSNKNTLDQYGEDLPFLAEMFESDNTVATLSNKGFTKGEAKRYTIVTWLEGEDIDAQGNPPKGGNLKLGVTINAYENNK